MASPPAAPLEEFGGEEEFAEFQLPLDRSPHHTVKHTFCPDGVLPMWVADMDLRCDEGIVAAIQERALHPTFGYTIQRVPLHAPRVAASALLTQRRRGRGAVRRPPELWEAVARWLRSEHGWEVRPDAFVFTGSLVTATVSALRAFTAVGPPLRVTLARILHDRAWLAPFRS